MMLEKKLCPDTALAMVEGWLVATTVTLAESFSTEKQDAYLKNSLQERNLSGEVIQSFYVV